MFRADPRIHRFEHVESWNTHITVPAWSWPRLIPLWGNPKQTLLSSALRILRIPKKLQTTISKAFDCFAIQKQRTRNNYTLWNRSFFVEWNDYYILAFVSNTLEPNVSILNGRSAENGEQIFGGPNRIVRFVDFLLGNEDERKKQTEISKLFFSVLDLRTWRKL